MVLHFHCITMCSKLHDDAYLASSLNITQSKLYIMWAFYKKNKAIELCSTLSTKLNLPVTEKTAVLNNDGQNIVIWKWRTGICNFLFSSYLSSFSHAFSSRPNHVKAVHLLQCLHVMCSAACCWRTGKAAGDTTAFWVCFWQSLSSWHGSCYFCCLTIVLAFCSLYLWLSTIVACSIRWICNFQMQ